GFASLFRFVGASDLFYLQLIQNGVYVWEGRTCFLSTAHTDDDLARVQEAVVNAVRSLREQGLLPPRRSAPATLATAPTSATSETSGTSQASQASQASAIPMIPAAQATPATADARAPTTGGQAALRLLAEFSPQACAAYNQSLLLDLQGPLDRPALEAALAEIVRRHEALRATFPADGTCQVIHAALPPDFRIETRAPDDDGFQAWLDDRVLAPLDLEHGPLLRARLLAMGDDHHRLLLVMPHLVVDGWS